jgi:hypothetical protein
MITLTFLIASVALGLALHATFSERRNRRSAARSFQELVEILPIMQRDTWIVCLITGCNQQHEEEYGDGSYEILGLGRNAGADQSGAVTNTAVRSLLDRAKAKPGDRVRIWMNRTDADSVSELHESLRCVVLRRSPMPIP